MVMSNLDFWVDEQSKNMALNFCKRLLPEALDLQRKLESARSDSIFVDGLIIGTGEEDFTKGNVEYEFTYKNHPFNIIDIPGIEGDEGKYESLIEKAIAKAHLIFYVNGTNKKPEVKTAEKIKKFLKRDTTVLAICNIRGKADSYESDEDRIELEKTHGGSDEAKSQTQEVLSGILGPEVLLGVESVQGLLGFCAVAFSENAISSISKKRATDLMKAQKNFYHIFCHDKETMKNFSRIVKLEDLIIAKNDTFKQDMIESNKKKIIRLIDDTLNILKNNLSCQQKITAKIETEFNECKSDINDNLKHHSTSIKSRRNLAVNSFFTNLEVSARESIQNHFKDNKRIEDEFQKTLNTESTLFENTIKRINNEYINEIITTIDNKTDKLKGNIDYIILQNEIEKNKTTNIPLKDLISLVNIKFSYNFSSLSKISKYALSGFSIGSVFPVIGAILGAIIGGVWGFFYDIIHSSSQSYKNQQIKDLQDALSKKIEEEKRNYINKFNKETNDYVDSIQNYYYESVNDSLSDECKKMHDIQLIIESQIITISKINELIRRKPYGSF